MSENVSADPHNDDQLLDLAVAIADGRQIDWPTLTSSDTPPEAESILVRLQRVERLVRGHDAMRALSSQPSAPAHETVLTEARRKATGADEPPRVQWGPLVVLDKIGRGSFGDVYRAWDPRLDREVALKLIPENTSDSASSPVVEEGRLLARVRHPNVLTVHGAERIDGRVGIWTEYIRGETLAEEIARRGPLPATEAARIGVDVCRALSAVHAAGLLHRDVKAQNILRDSTGRIVLGDFGTGVEFDEHAGIAEPQIAGTPLYLAPEIFDHRQATVGSDLYSLGVLLYFLVTANYPVRGGTFAEIRRAHSQGERVSLRDARRDLPEPFVQIVEALLRARERRFETAASLESVLGESIVETSSSRATQAAKRRLWLHVGVAAIVLAMIASGALAVLASMRQPRMERQIEPTRQPSTAPNAVEHASVPPIVSALAETTTNPSLVTARVNAGDWILVGSFDNMTGEAVLDGTIEAALKRELEYSEHVRVAQRDRWEDALRLLGRPLDSRLEPSLAREVCLRDGSIRGLVTGRVERTQSKYAITITIVNPTTGRDLATFTEEAPRQSQLLLSVRRQALRLRGALGETTATLDNARNELEQVPIPALAALSVHTKALVQGSVREFQTPVQSNEKWAGVEGLTRRAVHEDPAFAHAWIMLAWAVRNQGRPQDEYLPYARRAFELADTATPQERYFILGSFHQLNVAFTDGNSRNTDNPKELEQAASAYEALLTLQPDHYYVQNNLQRAYQVLGRDRDLALMRIRQAEARPANFRLNIDAAVSLVNEGTLPAARRYVARAEAALLPDAEVRDAAEWSDAQYLRAHLDWLDEKPAEALARLRRLDAAVDRVSGDRTTVIARPILLALTLGRLKDARELAERRCVWDGGAPMLLAYALREQGDLNGLREYMTSRWTYDHPAPATAIGWRVEFLVPAGMLEEADRDRDRYQRQTPAAALDTSFYPFIMGMLELGRGHPRQAAGFLQPWLALPNREVADFQWAAQKLAEARDAVGDTPNAIEVLEKAVERPPRLPAGLAVLHHMWLRSNAQLARLYRKTGQEQKAIAVEDRLLKLLAVADADHPLLKELKAVR